MAPGTFNVGALPEKLLFLLLEEGPQLKDEFPNLVEGNIQTKLRTIVELNRRGLLELRYHLTPKGRELIQAHEEKLKLRDL